MFEIEIANAQDALDVDTDFLLQVAERTLAEERVAVHESPCSERPDDPVPLGLVQVAGGGVRRRRGPRRQAVNDVRDAACQAVRGQGCHMPIASVFAQQSCAVPQPSQGFLRLGKRSVRCTEGTSLERRVCGGAGAWGR